ncbi:Leishmanolysin-like peptidase [Schistosoma japonicum]|nr:Leishmanolysin-like peptidase [Schistosoma japonicum]
MNLLLIVLYLSIFNEKLTECFKIKYPARGTKYNKRNMQRGSEFIVGEKFRIQVVMSESIKSLTLFSKFKGVLKKAVKFWTKVMHPKIQSKQQILIERDCSLRVRSKTLPQFHYCPGGCHSTKKCLEFQIPEKYLKGFMYSMLPYLRYENGDPRTRRNQQTHEPELEKHVNEGLEADQNTIKHVWRTWQTVAGVNGYRRIGLTLPSVVSFAKNHFRCNNLDAVDLESDGGTGSDLSHFERRLSVGEIMSAVHDPMASVSGLTLSYFKDSG